jgi:hypothetical protein
VICFPYCVFGLLLIVVFFHAHDIYHASTNLRTIHDPFSPIEVNGEQKYEVEDILNSRISNHQLQYFVHWHGHDVSEHIWESMINLLNAMEKVHEFH